MTKRKIAKYTKTHSISGSPLCDKVQEVKTNIQRLQVERLFCGLSHDEKQRFLLCDNISPENVALLLPTNSKLDDGQDCHEDGVDLLDGKIIRLTEIF